MALLDALSYLSGSLEERGWPLAGGGRYVGEDGVGDVGLLVAAIGQDADQDDLVVFVAWFEAWVVAIASARHGVTCGVRLPGDDPGHDLIRREGLGHLEAPLRF